MTDYPITPHDVSAETVATMVDLLRRLAPLVAEVDAVCTAFTTAERSAVTPAHLTGDSCDDEAVMAWRKAAGISDAFEGIYAISELAGALAGGSGGLDRQALPDLADRMRLRAEVLEANAGALV